MNLEPCPKTVINWGIRWSDWLASLYRYLFERALYHTATGSVTLAAATSTVVTDSGCLSTSKVFLTPTVTGGGFGGTNNIYISAKADGSFTLTHALGAAGLTFDYLIVNE